MARTILAVPADLNLAQSTLQLKRPWCETLALMHASAHSYG